MIQNTDTVAGKYQRIYFYAREIYLVHRNLGVGLTHLAASQVLDPQPLAEFAEVSYSHKNLTFAFGLLVATSVLSVISVSAGPVIEGIGYLLS